jgi:hypothetical protein
MILTVLPIIFLIASKILGYAFGVCGGKLLANLIRFEMSVLGLED